MTMTNAEILITECALHNVTEAVDTFAGWKRKGYSVKKGEHAVFKTSIWKPSKKRKEEDSTEETDDKKPYARMYMVKAAFFTASQVEPIKDASKGNS